MKKIAEEKEDENWDARTARLFACWCIRNTPLKNGGTVWDLLTDDRSKNAVKIAEQFANGKATKEELAAAGVAARAAAEDAGGAITWDGAGDPGGAVTWAAAEAATEDAARATAEAAAWAAAWAVAKDAVLDIAEVAIYENWDARTARLFACWCIRNTPLKNGGTVWDLLTDDRSKNAVKIAEEFANGKATKEELAAARDAAEAAAEDAGVAITWDGAGDPGGAITWAAAEAAGEDAAGSTARAAAWAAARAAAEDIAEVATRDAVWDAAWDAAEAIQTKELLRILNEVRK